MAAEPLPDPESHWERAPALASVDRAEVERRLGPIDGPLIVLGGGQANVNVRITPRVTDDVQRRIEETLSALD
jgi:hypothetical protein